MGKLQRTISVCVLAHSAHISCRYVGKDVFEPLNCCILDSDGNSAADSSQEIIKDNLLVFSRHNTKLRAAEADFERLLRSKEDTKQLFSSLSDGGREASLLKIEV